MSSNAWFTLPEDDEKALEALVDRYGVARVLAVLSRFQLAREKQAKADDAKLRPRGPDELGL